MNLSVFKETSIAIFVLIPLHMIHWIALCWFIPALMPHGEADWKKVVIGVTIAGWSGLARIAHDMGLLPLSVSRFGFITGAATIVWWVHVGAPVHTAVSH